MAKDATSEDPRVREIIEIAARLSGGAAEPGRGAPVDLDGALEALRRAERAIAPVQTFFEGGADGFFFMMLDEPVDWHGTADKEALLDHVFLHQRITRANHAMLAQYGFAEDEFLGLTPTDLFSHDLSQGRAAWRELFDAGSLETRTYEQRRDGSKFWVHGTYVTMHDPRGWIIGHFGTQRDVTREVEIVDALRRSEDRLAEAQRVAHIGLWDWNILTNDLHWSDEVFRILEHTPGVGPVTYDDFLAAVHLDDVDAVRSAVDAALVGAPYSMEHRLVLPSGEERWVHERGAVTFDADGRPTRMLGTVQDITDRKLSERRLETSLHEKEVLLQEIHHRVKNNLQIIKSLLHLQRSKLPGDAAAAAFQESMDRIQVMALLHERLYQSRNLASISLPDYLETLVASLSESYVTRDRGVAVHVRADDQALHVDRAIPLGLLITEVVSNAIKHAFSGRSRGSVHVEGRALPSGAYRVVMRDDGVGLPEGFDVEHSGGLGLKLVRSLARQLGAELRVTSDGGARFELSLRAPATS